VILHVVLFRPRAALTQVEAEDFVAALEALRAVVPNARQFWVGRRLTDAPHYKMSGFPDFPYVAAIAFDDRESLNAYLQHPVHERFSRRFNEAAEAALIYDFEVADAAEAGGMIGIQSANHRVI
jgi:hypothetical protein